MNRVALFLRRMLAVIAICHFTVLPLSRIHAATKAHALPKGTWGGDHITLQVTEKGAEVEFDCAHGQITQPIKLDRKGNFNLRGTFAPEHGGPVLRDEGSHDEPVRYVGHTDGTTMTLTVDREKEKLGAFVLTRSRQSNLMKCR